MQPEWQHEMSQLRMSDRLLVGGSPTLFPQAQLSPVG